MHQRYIAALDRVAAMTSADSDERPCGTWWGESSPLVHQLKIVVPPRSKYCNATRKCIPIFDHYCVFLRAPIGRDNYAKFIAVLGFTAATSICVFAASLLQVLGSPAGLMSPVPVM